MAGIGVYTLVLGIVLFSMGFAVYDTGIALLGCILAIVGFVIIMFAVAAAPSCRDGIIRDAEAQQKREDEYGIIEENDDD